MFTGIVEERGEVVLPKGGGQRLAVRAPKVFEEAPVGASVSVNGVCLTVAERDAGVLTFDLAAETMARTTLGALQPGEHVNLERPLTLATRLGGHLVQGHVDGVGEVESVEPAPGGATMRVRLPAGLARYVVEKGSMALDGVSLTVAGVDDGSFTVALIPHTLAATTLGERGAGARVNVEVDVVSKYVENLLRRDR